MTSAPEQFSVSTVDQFVVIPAWILAADISPNALKLYALLRRVGNNETGVSFYSRSKLAVMLGGVSVKTVDRAMSSLIQLGAVRKQARMNDNGEMTSNTYQVLTRPFEGGRDKSVATGQGSRPGRDTSVALTKNHLTKTPLPPSDDSSPAGPECPKHGFARAYGCRGCGTTKRQLAAAAEEAHRAAAPRRCSECFTKHPLDDMTRIGDEQRLVCRVCLPAD